MKCNIDNSYTKGYRVRIYPTEDQKKQIQRNIELSRAVYNLGLEILNKAYEENERHIKFYEMCKIFSDMRNSKEYEWLQELGLGVIRQTLLNLENAFQMFFSKINKYPKFKSKKRSKKSFSTRSDRCTIMGEYIGISGLKDTKVLAKKHNIPDHIRLYDTVVSWDGYDGYWFSCTVQSEPIDMSNIPKSEPIGIDVGIRNMITTSDGDFYKYSNTSNYEKRLKRQQRRLSKDYNKYLEQAKSTRTKYEDIPKSKNHMKKLEKRYKTISKIHNKRMNDIHTATKRIVDKNPSAIVIEDLSVREMLSDKWIHKYAPKMMFYEIHRQIQYKAFNRGIPVIKADKEFPSSQICSRCGQPHKVYRNKVFKCPYCGYKEDRDLNAAYNLRDLAYQSNS